MAVSPVSTQNKMYKRDPGQRVFVNRNVELGKIKWFGFDMDYTLAVYKSPQYEELGYKLTIERLISIGYPPELRSLRYSRTFSVRGLWFDKLYGNLLKVDAYGHILAAVHGQEFLENKQVEELYPNKFIQLSEARIYVLNTLFNLPETVVLSSLIHYMDLISSSRGKDGLHMGDIYMSYKQLFNDVREAVEYIHKKGNLKRETVERIKEFVLVDERLPVLLNNLRAAGRKTFLLTNSDFWYTNKLMTFLMNGGDWTQFFDFIIVDAEKPQWFAEGSIFRRVDKGTGALKIGMHTGPLKPGQIYSGGSCQVFSELVGIRGKDVVYVGDHIFGDVLRSKKGRGWRTFLIIPELADELRVWIKGYGLFAELEMLTKMLAEFFKNMDINSVESSMEHVSGLRKQIMEVTDKMDQAYGATGSMFRCGSRKTFFASQVERYADLYAGSCCNLTKYPLFYYFRADPLLMPHESTVDRENAYPKIGGNASPPASTSAKKTTGAGQPSPKTPPKTAFLHDDQSDDDGSKPK